MGSKEAQKELEQAPDCPEEVEYLVEWSQALYGRSGVGMSGAAPLSYQTIETWARLMDIGKLSPLEVEALILLDTAFIPEDETAKDGEVILPSSSVSRPWPKSKAPKES